MNKKITTLILLIFICWCKSFCFSQNEIITEASTSIHKKQKLKGFNVEYLGASNPYYYYYFHKLSGDFSTGAFSTDPYKNSNYLLNTFTLYYFQEHLINQQASIILKGGIHYTPIKTKIASEIYDGENVIYNLSRIQYTDHYGILLSVEPRYYIRLKKDDIHSSIYHFNCGFITVPLDYVTYTNLNGHDLIKLYFSPQLGFRQSISNHIFVEAMFGCRITGSYGLSTQTISPYCLPTASIKVCYSL
jgi:hypothetical protein